MVKGADLINANVLLVPLLNHLLDFHHKCLAHRFLISLLVTQDGIDYSTDLVEHFFLGEVGVNYLQKVVLMVLTAENR